ncbi:hypothetical protein, partial [Mesorhizobium sp. M7D.F.Ca.US.004.03.1.1]|uniref:hypothetical protein n=1 Tax=Mesorhizobium sp. M7D.F.Ca.US.004.03.1.1 TaxID=2496702 RepID=UPI0019D24694
TQHRETDTTAAERQTDEQENEGGDGDSQDDTPSTVARSHARPWATGVTFLPWTQLSPARRACQVGRTPRWQSILPASGFSSSLRRIISPLEQAK